MMIVMITMVLNGLVAGVSFLYLFADYLTQFFFDDMLIYWTVNSLMGILHLFLVITGVSIDLKNAIATSRKVYPEVSRKESMLR